MKWFDNFINKPIAKILRLDKDEDYEFYQPFGIFLMFDNERGLLVGAINDGNSISIDISTLKEVYDEYGIEFSETSLNELKPDDELNAFVGQSIKKIKVGEYKSDEIKGDNFIIKQGLYSGVVIVTETNQFSYYNHFGGHLSIDTIDNDLQFPNTQRWTMNENGC